MLNNKIHVSVRLKPLCPSEEGSDRNSQWQVVNGNQIRHRFTKETYTFGKKI